MKKKSKASSRPMKKTGKGTKSRSFGSGTSGGAKRKKSATRRGPSSGRGTGTRSGSASGTGGRKKVRFRKRPERQSDPTQQRLQKVLAALGFGSRRECEELILEGRVEVNRETVTELGTRIDPAHCEIRVDGQVLKKHKPAYLAVYKPKGYVCTNKDEKGRRRAVDLVPDSFGRVFPVGRLDMNSEGLLLLTNDGELTNRLTHPKYGVPKVYRVQVAGIVQRSTLAQLEEGMYLAEGHAHVEGAVIKGFHKNSTILEITLREGKNREIRRLLARVQHKVMTLIRYSIGPVKLGKMLPGEYRVLTGREVTDLYEATVEAGAEMQKQAKREK